MKPRRESRVAQREHEFPLGDDECGYADIVQQHPAELDEPGHGAGRIRWRIERSEHRPRMRERHDPMQVLNARDARGFRVAAMHRSHAERFFPARRCQAAVELVARPRRRAARPRPNFAAARGSSRCRHLVHDDAIGVRKPRARDVRRKLVEERVAAAPVWQSGIVALNGKRLAAAGRGARIRE